MLHFKGIENSSALVQKGFAYWQSKCKDGETPRWSEINPTEIKSLLPNLVVLHVHYDPLDFVERITGDAILSRSHANSMGQNWRDYEGRGPGSAIWNVMEEVVTHKQPSFHSIPYVGPHQEFMKVDTVACPLLNKDGKITRILTFVDYLPTDESDSIDHLITNDTSRRFVL